MVLVILQCWFEVSRALQICKYYNFEQFTEIGNNMFFPFKIITRDVQNVAIFSNRTLINKSTKSTRIISAAYNRLVIVQLPQTVVCRSGRDRKMWRDSYYSYVSYVLERLCVMWNWIFKRLQQIKWQQLRVCNDMAAAIPRGPLPQHSWLLHVSAHNGLGGYWCIIKYNIIM